jgi:ATP adenylyltransferase
MEYIRMDKPDACILCEKPGEDNDPANYILLRATNNFVMLNCYPYNPGHLLIAPYRHVSSLEELSDEERHEHLDVVSRGVRVLREVFNPAGFNIGMNIGTVAGAGIADHIHTHIVPRWQGDSNFMPIVADTRVLPESLVETYQQLKGKF